MKITLQIPKEYDVKFLKATAGARYWEDTDVNGIEDKEGDLIPCRNGEYWEPLINVDTGQIVNWTQGTTADIHYKVCDDGVYQLFDENMQLITKIEGYVPDIMCPEPDGYGDYIIMDINADGFIANWKPTFGEFTNQDRD